jgi:putative transposase
MLCYNNIRSKKQSGGIMITLDNNNHSVFLLYYHLIMVIKYRRKVIDDDISNRLKEIFENTSPNYNISLQEWNHDKDYVHILFKAEPNSELSKFINAYKSASSRLIKKEYPQIKQKLWKEYFWSRSYCLLTTGGAPIEVIKQYIESQGEKK